MTWNSTFVCRNPMPGIRCNLWESYILAVLFLICAFVSIFFLIKHFPKTQKKCRIFDQTVLFWFSLAIWQLYRFTVTLVPFHWDPQSFSLFFTAFNHFLLFIPMCLVILILFDLLFTYRNPGTNAIFFFRSLFMIFLVTFLVIGLILCFLDVDGHGDDPEMSLTLWCACTDLVLALFFIFPALKLLEAVKYPMVQPEDRGCINFCTVSMWIYLTIFILRMIWNFTHFIDKNILIDFQIEDIKSKEPGVPTRLRIMAFCFYFLFDLIPSSMSMVAVYLFKKHDMMFNENPYYTKQSE